jgi:hypothetical protein
MDHATQVVTRTCQRCRERWQLVVTPSVVHGRVRVDHASFTFLGKGRVK